MADDVKLFNPHAGLTGRDGGPYLDQVERIEAEKRRAIVEGREPADLSDPDALPATAGTPLVTAAELIRQANPTANPSMQGVDPVGNAVTLAADNDDFPVNVHSKREDILTGDDNDNYDAAANPTVGSVDPDEKSKDDPFGNAPAPSKFQDNKPVAKKS